MKDILFLINLLILFAITGCDAEEVEPEEAGSMTCTLNGSLWEAISFDNILYKINSEPKGKRLDIRAKGMGIEITLGMSLYTDNLDDSMPLVKYKTNSGIYGSIVAITDGWIVPEILGGGGYGEVILTEIVPDEKKISGTFSFDSNSYNSDEEEYVAVGGVFTDLIFKVQ